MNEDSGTIPISFEAEQLVATTFHVRRTAGGAELGLHHWLLAVLKYDAVARQVLVNVDRTALAEQLGERLEAGDIGYPLSKAEALTRARQRAGREGHEVVSTHDLSYAIVAASAALLKRLAPRVRDDFGEPERTSKPTPTSPSSSPHRPSIWERVQDGVADLFDSDVMGWIGIALLVFLLAAPIVYITSRQRTEDAETAVRDRVEAFASALADGDGDAACEMLTDEAKNELTAQVGRRFAERRAGSCASAVRVAANDRTTAQTAALRDVVVLDVDSTEEWSPGFGDYVGTYERSTAIVELPSGEVHLETEAARTERAGNWTIVAADPILDLMAPA